MTQQYLRFSQPIFFGQFRQEMILISCYKWRWQIIQYLSHHASSSLIHYSTILLCFTTYNVCGYLWWFEYNILMKRYCIPFTAGYQIWKTLKINWWIISIIRLQIVWILLFRDKLQLLCLFITFIVRIQL